MNYSTDINISELEYRKIYKVPTDKEQQEIDKINKLLHDKIIPWDIKYSEDYQKGIILEDIVDSAMLKTGIVIDISEVAGVKEQVHKGDRFYYTDTGLKKVEIKSSHTFNDTMKQAQDLYYMKWDGRKLVPYNQEESTEDHIGWYLRDTETEWLISINYTLHKDKFIIANNKEYQRYKGINKPLYINYIDSLPRGIRTWYARRHNNKISDTLEGSVSKDSKIGIVGMCDIIKDMDKYNIDYDIINCNIYVVFDNMSIPLADYRKILSKYKVKEIIELSDRRIGILRRKYAIKKA